MGSDQGMHEVYKHIWSDNDQVIRIRLNEQVREDDYASIHCDRLSLHDQLLECKLI